MGFSLKKLANNFPGVGMINDMFKDPQYPKLPEPEVIPVKDEAAQRKARRKAIAARMAKSGRASTMLTQDSESLG